MALEQQHNRSASSQGRHQFQFRLYADNIKTVDAYKLTKIICRQVSSTCWDAPSFDLIRYQETIVHILEYNAHTSYCIHSHIKTSYSMYQSFYTDLLYCKSHLTKKNPNTLTEHCL